MIEIKIPQSGATDDVNLEFEKNLIIVGANGAGKTRLGSKIEQTNNPTKRISAQRYLQLEETVPKQDFDTAANQLRTAYKNSQPIQPQNDFTNVLISLFAEEARRDAQYVAASRQSTEKVGIPDSTKEKVLAVWNFVFPYRVLKLDDDKVRAANESTEFSAVQMSDGEKVGLYLISQILLADKDCILIIDEPELHLHKALMVRLWNKLEEIRSDCTFIYITHDLDFAVNKPAGKLVWIRSFKGNVWEWEEVYPNEVIPESLFLEIIGSRKPILFVEGEKGSLDIQIYQAYYENFTVVPRGSCEKVIESVKGLKGNDQLHNKEVFGLIDRDFRSDDQLEALRADGIFSIPVNKIENLFLLPEIIEIISNHLGKNDSVKELIEAIRDIYETDKEQIGFAASKFPMQQVLNIEFGSVRNQQQYDEFKESILKKLDEKIVSPRLPDRDADLIEILKVYPYKGLVKRVQTKLELTRDGYRNVVLSFLTSEKRAQIIAVLKTYLPDIAQ